MFTAEYNGINDFLVGASQLLLEYGVKRETRNNCCYELPEPFVFKINYPTARWVTIPERKWNLSLPYAESLWLASGRNDMEYISHYLKRMMDFSDDKKFMRGGYGPRFRFFNGSSNDYQINIGKGESGTYIDQFKYIVECFKDDPNTRRAVLNIDDTMKDEFGDDGKIKVTKDIPCTRLLHFQRNSLDGRLDLTVFMRSNDFLWGASAVNIFNFTFIQEYISAMLGMGIGSYYHIANNFHYYEDKRNKVELIASIDKYEEMPFTYKKTFTTLEEFDRLCDLLAREETHMRLSHATYRPEIFEDDFFKDWYSILFHKNHPEQNISFVNNQLYNLIGR